MLPVIIGAGFIFGSVALLAYYVSRNIVRVPPDQAIVLTGRRAVVADPSTGAQKEVGHRVITGGSAFQIPLIERMDILPLSEMSIQIDADDLRDIEGYARSVSVLVNCRVTAEEPYLDRAIVRFLSMDLEDIETIARTTIESRVSNTLLTVDLSGIEPWPDVQATLDSAIRDDLATLGITVDTVIFRRIPVANIPAETVNGQEHLQAD